LREALDAIEEHERRKTLQLQPRPAVAKGWDKLTLPKNLRPQCVHSDLVSDGPLAAIKKAPVAYGLFGEPGWDRTIDHLIKSEISRGLTSPTKTLTFYKSA
jgi:hypothetical protein